MVETENSIYHNHSQEAPSLLLSKTQTDSNGESFDPDKIPYLLLNTFEAISTFPEDSKDLVISTLTDPDFQQGLPHLSALLVESQLDEELSNRRVGALSEIKGHLFEYIAYTYHKSIINCDQEVVSPEFTNEVYQKKKLQDHFTNKLERRGVPKNKRLHSELDTLLLEKRGDITQIIGGCEITTARGLNNSTKSKQIKQMNSREVCIDLTADNDSKWIHDLGELFNGHYNDKLPKKVVLDTRNFHTFLFLPMLGKGEREEKDLATFDGIIHRPPFTRRQLDILVSAIDIDIGSASTIVTEDDLKKRNENNMSFSNHYDSNGEISDDIRFHNSEFAAAD